MAMRFTVTIDCADPAHLGEFWAQALGYKVEDPPAGHATWQDWLVAQRVPEELWNSRNALVDPEGRGPRLLFQQVPEPKTGKNRLHLDLHLSGDRNQPMDQRRSAVQAAAERLRDLGATIGPALEEHGVYWIVMQDPEGNEFCVH